MADLTHRRGTTEQVIARIEKGGVDIDLTSKHSSGSVLCEVGDEVFVFNVFGVINLRHIPATGLTNAELTNFGGFLRILG